MALSRWGLGRDERAGNRVGAVWSWAMCGPSLGESDTGFKGHNVRPHPVAGPGSTQRTQKTSLCKNRRCRPALFVEGPGVTGSLFRRRPGPQSSGRSSRGGCFLSNATSLGLKITLQGAGMGMSPAFEFLAWTAFSPTVFPGPASDPPP